MLRGRTGSRPTELAIALATLPDFTTEWWAADEVRGVLALLGFDCSTQQVAAWLGRMATSDAPWVERQRAPWGDWQYRITRYGRTDLNNRLRTVHPVVPPPGGNLRGTR